MICGLALSRQTVKNYNNLVEYGSERTAIEVLTTLNLRIEDLRAPTTAHGSSFHSFIYLHISWFDAESERAGIARATFILGSSNEFKKWKWRI